MSSQQAKDFADKYYTLDCTPIDRQIYIQALNVFDAGRASMAEEILELLLSLRESFRCIEGVRDSDDAVIKCACRKISEAIGEDPPIPRLLKEHDYPARKLYYQTPICKGEK